jgi:proteasome lid subunit RPN8/RPN11
MVETLVLPPAVRRVLIGHAHQTSPQECCGLLIGRDGTVFSALPTANVEQSVVRFRIDSRAHIDARRVLRGFDPPLMILGSYHSHPAGHAKPSPTDIAEAAYPEWVHLIIGLAGTRAVIAGFRIRDGRADRVRLVTGGALRR